MPWADRDVAILTKLYKKGNTCNQPADALQVPLFRLLVGVKRHVEDVERTFHAKKKAAATAAALRAVPNQGTIPAGPLPGFLAAKQKAPSRECGSASMHRLGQSANVSTAESYDVGMPVTDIRAHKPWTAVAQDCHAVI